MPDHQHINTMNTQKQETRTNRGPSLKLKTIGRMTVVHSTYRTPAQQRAMREVSDRNLSQWERDYLNWYHGDPCKNSLIKAREYSMNNREGLLASNKCGCFHCGEVFRPSRITEWFADNTDRTAFCPHCDIDAVIGDASGYPIIPEFLGAMKARWYGE